MQLINYILLLCGLVYLITQSGIVAPFRALVSRLGLFFEALVYCQACTGFWVGLALAYTGHWPFTGWPIESAIAGAALGALWKEWGCQTNTHQQERAPKPPTEAERQRAFQEALKAGEATLDAMNERTTAQTEKKA